MFNALIVETKTPVENFLTSQSSRTEGFSLTEITRKLKVSKKAALRVLSHNDKYISGKRITLTKVEVEQILLEGKADKMQKVIVSKKTPKNFIESSDKELYYNDAMPLQNIILILAKKGILLNRLQYLKCFINLSKTYPECFILTPGGRTFKARKIHPEYIEFVLEYIKQYHASLNPRHDKVL